MNRLERIDESINKSEIYKRQNHQNPVVPLASELLDEVMIREDMKVVSVVMASSKITTNDFVNSPCQGVTSTNESSGPNIETTPTIVKAIMTTVQHSVSNTAVLVSENKIKV